MPALPGVPAGGDVDAQVVGFGEAGDVVQGGRAEDTHHPVGTSTVDVLVTDSDALRTGHLQGQTILYFF